MRMLIKSDPGPALVVAPKVLPRCCAQLIIIIPCSPCHLAANGHLGDSSPGCHFPTSSWAGSGDSRAQGTCLRVKLRLSVVEGMGFPLRGCLRSCLPGQELVIQGSLVSTKPSTYTHPREAQMQPSVG